MSLMIDFRYGCEFPYPGAAPNMYLVEARDQKAGLSARRSIKVVDSDVDLALHLTPPVSINGAARGGIPTSIQLEAQESIVAAIKPDGTFVIPGVQPVPYTVRVEPPQGAYVKSILMGEQTLAAPRIDMAHASGPLTITFGRDGGALTGEVDSDSATVVLAPAGALAAWGDLTKSPTAKDGRFEFHDIAPGDYQLFAWEDAEPGAPLDPEFRRPFADRAATVHVAPNGGESLQLKAIRP